MNISLDLHVKHQTNHGVFGGYKSMILHLFCKNGKNLKV